MKLPRSQLGRWVTAHIKPTASTAVDQIIALWLVDLFTAPSTRPPVPPLPPPLPRYWQQPVAAAGLSPPVLVDTLLLRLCRWSFLPLKEVLNCLCTFYPRMDSKTGCKLSRNCRFDNFLLQMRMHDKLEFKVELRLSTSHDQRKITLSRTPSDTLMTGNDNKTKKKTNKKTCTTVKKNRTSWHDPVHGEASMKNIMLHFRSTFYRLVGKWNHFVKGPHGLTFMWWGLCGVFCFVCFLFFVFSLDINHPS